MSLASLVIALALFLAGCLAGDLKQPQVLITKLVTTTVKIPCEAAALADIHWYQQHAAQAPRRILCFSKDRTERDLGVPAKFSAESSDSFCFLVIDNIELTDAASYYCARWIVTV